MFLMKYTIWLLLKVVTGRRINLFIIYLERHWLTKFIKCETRLHYINIYYMHLTSNFLPIFNYRKWSGRFHVSCIKTTFSLCNQVQSAVLIVSLKWNKRRHQCFEFKFLNSMLMQAWVLGLYNCMLWFLKFI